MKIFLIKEKQARSRGEYLYWNNEEGWSHKILATRFYEDNKEHLSFPIDGEWVEETDGPQYLPFHVNTSNQDDSEEGVQATSDEGKLYVRVGNIDIRIKQTDNGKGVKIEAFDHETAMQDLDSMIVWYDDVETPAETEEISNK